MLPLLGEYVDSGYREPKDRILYSLRSNARYQLLILGSATVGLIYIIFQNGFKFNSLKALVMALAYVWGLVLAIYLMGHGLVAIPRTLVRNSRVGNRLRKLENRAPRIHDRLTDAIVDLEGFEAQVNQLQRRKSSVPKDLQEWIDELADTVGTPESRTRLSTFSEDSRRIPTIITKRFLADLSRRLNRARHQKARFEDIWGRLVDEADDLQLIINSSASKRLVFRRSSSSLSIARGWSLLNPSSRYVLHVHILPWVRLAFAALFSLASVSIIWSELVKSFAPQLSIVNLTTIARSEEATVGIWRQLMASAWIFYMCWAALVGISDAKVWGNRALVRRNTYGESACWYAGQIAKLTVPLSYNFLTLLPWDIQYGTTFYAFLGRFIDLTPLGKGFDYFFPIFVLIPVFATLFNLYGKLKSICGFGILEEDDSEIGGWQEGRDLIDRELNGLGSLGLTPRKHQDIADARTSAHGTISHRSTPSIRSPPAESSRSPLSQLSRTNSMRRSGATLPQDDDEEEEEENAFQSFIHRVKNTIDTANTPQWFQGSNSGFTRPRWMMAGEEQQGNTGTTEGSSGLGRWFGGRGADGKLRL